MLKQSVNRFLYAIAYVLLSICLDTAASADESDHVAGEVAESIRNYVDLIHEQFGFSGVVLAARDGKVVAAIPRGYADQRGTVPIKSTTLFEVASCTKMFTAIAVLQLAESGKLSLDASIADQLPDVPANCKAITIRHLLSHTSGIPGTNTTGAGDEIKNVIPTFLLGGPQHPPGTHYEYWNQGYALLSEIIANASGRPYTQYMRDEIFDPCKMSVSRFTGDDAPEGASVAVGKSSRGASRSALDHPYKSYGFQYRGMGGLVTNVEDLWKWDRAMRRNHFISEQFAKEMTSPGPGGGGLGCSITNDPTGKASHLHNGRVRGFLADVRRYPSVDGAIFVLSNNEEPLPFRLIGVGVEQILFGNEPRVSLPHKLNADTSKRIAGQYVDANGRRLVIEKAAALPSIKIYWGRAVTAGIVGLSDSDTPGLFMTKPSKGAIEFIKDVDLEFLPSEGQAVSVSLIGLTPKLTFKRTN